MCIRDRLAVSPCWHESQIDQMFCDECSPFHKVEDVAEVRATEAAEKLTTDPDSNNSYSTVDSRNVGRCLGCILSFPLLNSTSVCLNTADYRRYRRLPQTTLILFYKCLEVRIYRTLTFWLTPGMSICPRLKSKYCRIDLKHARVSGKFPAP